LGAANRHHDSMAWLGIYVRARINSVKFTIVKKLGIENVRIQKT
jgi:hypothetical protein